MKIFQPDNFSKSIIEYFETDYRAGQWKNIFDCYFNKYKIVKTYCLNRQAINSQNYKVILNIGGKNKTYLLKKNIVLSDLGQINFYLTVIEKLAKQKVKVSRLIKTKQGELSAIIDNGVYNLYEFIEANYFIPNKPALFNIAVEIGKMHLVFNKFTTKQIKQIDTYSKKSGAYFNKIKSYNVADLEMLSKIVKNVKRQSSEEKKFLSLLPKLKFEVGEIKRRQKQINSLPRQIIHSDLHPHNILMNQGRVAAIIDFDGLRISQQARDAGHALYRLGRQFFINSDKADIGGNGRRLKDLFIKNYNKIKQFTPEEIALMPLLVKDEFLRKLLFVLKSIYLENNKVWIKDLPKFMSAFEEIDYFF